MSMDGIIPYVLGGGGGGGGSSAATVAAMISGTEDTATASQGYSVGEYFIYNDALYIVTSPISQGDTITPGTNCDTTTVCENLSGLFGAINLLNAVYQNPTWVIGSINTSNGTEASATNQIRSDFIRCDTGTRISCASGYQFIVCKYNIDTAAYIEASGSWQSTEYVLGGRYWIRVILRRSNQSTIVNAKDISPYIYIGDYEIGNTPFEDSFTYTDSGSSVTGIDDVSGGTIKLPNGIMIQYGVGAEIINITSQWSTTSMYYGTCPDINFHEAFTHKPVVSIQIGDKNSAFVMSSNATTTKITRAQFCRPVSTPNAGIIFYWIAIGTWK